MALNCFPRLTVKHTSKDVAGQVHSWWPLACSSAMIHQPASPTPKVLLSWACS